MLKKLLVIGSLAMIAATSAKARIGWTLEQCIAAYGKDYESFPDKDGSATYTFKTDYFEITVDFAPGSKTVGQIQYDAKTGMEDVFMTGDDEKDYKQEFSFFTVKEVKELLQKNTDAVWSSTRDKKYRLTNPGEMDAGEEIDYVARRNGKVVANANYLIHLFGSKLSWNKNVANDFRYSAHDHPSLQIKTAEYQAYWDAIPVPTPEPEKSATEGL